jgi:peptidyl-prolyl cis-trans isomerase B (cyclophilin B)
LSLHEAPVCFPRSPPGAPVLHPQVPNEKTPVEATPAPTAPAETAASEKAPAEATPAPKAPVETAAAEKPPVEKAPDAVPATKEVAVIKTTMGEMVAEFWPDVAPKTVENFIQLAKSGFYDGTAFHRIIKGFMIQGGDPLTKDPSKEDRWGTGSADHYVKAEFNDRHHVRGVLSMARAQDPDSASCQFFICLDDAPNLDGKYTAFGKLIKGEDVLMKLGDTPVAGPGNHPVERAGIESIKIVPADSIK